MDEQAIWDAYNLLLCGPDVERLRKLLVRQALFMRTLDVPGDIVEAGVFKGTGLMLWLKLLQIYAPGSAKRVIGFDLFEGFEDSADDAERPHVKALLDESGFTGTTPEAIQALAEAAGMAGRCQLVAGDIGTTAAKLAQDEPGFRISLLHLDLDLEKPTLATLQALWPRVARGGLVVFDEYAVPKWTASAGIDEWMGEHDLRLQTLPWARTPTCFLIKP